LIYNAGAQFPADWARQAAKSAGSELDLRPGSVDAPALVTWLEQKQIDAPRRTSR
jgi:hypothetical protein